jgi:hypothetical protein
MTAHPGAELLREAYPATGHEGLQQLPGMLSADIAWIVPRLSG